MPVIINQREHSTYMLVIGLTGRVEYHIYHQDKFIVLHHIQINDKGRGKGKRVIDILKRRYGMDIWLEAWETLVPWYESQGFVRDFKNGSGYWEMWYRVGGPESLAP